MMLHPAMKDLLEQVPSRYMLVNVIARRARQISEKAEENGQFLEQKPVSIAVEEVAKGMVSLDY